MPPISVAFQDVQLLALLSALALLVCNAAAGLASGLAGSLALAATAVLSAVAQVTSFDGLDMLHSLTFHLFSLWNKNNTIHFPCQSCFLSLFQHFFNIDCVKTSIFLQPFLSTTQDNKYASIYIEDGDSVHALVGCSDSRKRNRTRSAWLFLMIIIGSKQRLPVG